MSNFTIIPLAVVDAVLSGANTCYPPSVEGLVMPQQEQ